MIIRVEKRKRFTITSNVPIEDERLSWEALGVLCWLLSKPDGWEALRAAVSNQKRGAGRDKAARIFAELQAANYMLRRKLQRKDGRFDWFSLIFEEAFVDLNGKTAPGVSVNGSGKPATVPSSSVEPAVAPPSPEDSALSKTHRSKTDRSKTRRSKDARERGNLPRSKRVVCKSKTQTMAGRLRVGRSVGRNRKNRRLRSECRIRGVQGLLHCECEGIWRLARRFRRLDTEDKQVRSINCSFCNRPKRRPMEWLSRG